ncbi:hypothetical protein QTP70_007505 [Hemibagrus guttatus]|uniref:Uncharacterized protein n=1 Tax=Hemibagrus guttatus TaxID=175788 RepID=A0AAE0RBP8_9TELE|nr:hypothetical protein QTP70_007505 [Hemibagrus guttatus]
MTLTGDKRNLGDRWRQGRKPEYLEKTPEAQGEHVNIHMAEVGIEPPTVEPCGTIVLLKASAPQLEKPWTSGDGDEENWSRLDLTECLSRLDDEGELVLIQKEKVCEREREKRNERE